MTKHDLYTEIEVPEVKLIQNANEMYNNKVVVKEWTKEDPKDSKILALTIHLSNL